MVTGFGCKNKAREPALGTGFREDLKVRKSTPEVFAVRKKVETELSEQIADAP